MKKYLLLFLVIVCSFQMEAQENPNKNNWTLGGPIVLSRSNTFSTYEGNILSGDFLLPNISKNTSLFGSLNPYLAKRLSNKSMIGLGLIFERLIQKTLYGYNIAEPILGNERKTTTNTVGLNSFYRQHIFTVRKIEIFLQGKMEFLSSKVKYEHKSNSVNEDVSSSLEYRATLDPGVAYSLSDKWNIVLIINGLKYQYLKFNETNTDYSSTNNIFSINTPLKNTQFGIEFRF